MSGDQRHARVTLGEALRMHGLYKEGLSLDAVGLQFRRGKSTVSRAFAEWGLPIRPRGWNARQPKPRRPSEPIVFRPPAEKSFCGQCERRVSVSEAARCRSQFCKAIPPTQRQGLAQSEGAR